MSQKISYAIGTTVKIIKGFMAGHIGVVHHVTLAQGALLYSVTGSSGYSHADLEWVSDPTVRTLAIASSFEESICED